VATRSFLLAAVRLAATENRLVYTVPAGHTVIIKTITGTHSGSSPGASLFVQLDGPADTITPLYMAASDIGVYNTGTWLVVPGGTGIRLSHFGNTDCDVAVSGTLLEGEA
jgi:hypothetical protein